MRSLSEKADLLALPASSPILDRRSTEYRVRSVRSGVHLRQLGSSTRGMTAGERERKSDAQTPHVSALSLYVLPSTSGRSIVISRSVRTMSEWTFLSPVLVSTTTS